MTSSESPEDSRAAAAGNDAPTAWWYWPLALAVMPFSIAACLVLAGLVILAMPFIFVVLWWQRRRFVRLMRERGRYISWKDLEPLLLAGRGTLIVEQRQNVDARVWWTPDDVLRESPTAAPAEEDLDYIRMRTPDPFVSWCAARYVSPESGRALLTGQPYPHPGGFFERTFFRSKFPDLQVVMTVRLA